MGDPKKTRKKYQKPMHPWQKERIEEEKIIVKEYGIKNKRELWKMKSLLKNFKDQAKNLIALSTPQAAKEKNLLIAKLSRLGLLKEAKESLDPILDLTLRDILERRLQTQVYKKGLAKTVGQARQFITHGHISIGDKSLTSPSYVINVQEEGLLSFSPLSMLKDEMHPERIKKEDMEKHIAEAAKPKIVKEEKKDDRRGGRKMKRAPRREMRRPETRDNKKEETKKGEKK